MGPRSSLYTPFLRPVIRSDPYLDSHPVQIVEHGG